MTGFELNRTHRHINNINEIALQITAKSGKKSVNLQPVANRNRTLQTRLHPRERSHKHSPGPVTAPRTIVFFRVQSSRWACTFPSMTSVSIQNSSTLTHRIIPGTTQICLHRVGSRTLSEHTSPSWIDGMSESRQPASNFRLARYTASARRDCC